MKANVYVDGFNLYYGAVKNTPYRWLDISAMCRLLLPKDDLHRIKYFTALVDPRPSDPDQRVRQETFLRALATIPNLSIFYGFFLTHEVTMPRVGGGYAQVIKTEEKGSDVNLATQLLVDAYHDDYEIAVIVSNDSDLLMPVQVVTREFKKPVGLLNPQKNPSRALLPHVAFIKQIRPGVLAKSQFPKTLTDSRGSFSKPASW
jgi:uncharacterized LabA/DUF88 family protein